MVASNEDDGDWDDIGTSKWKGLGISDPVKSVEARSACFPDPVEGYNSRIHRISGFYFLLF